MAKNRTPTKKPRRLVGMEKVVGIFADAYLILHSGGAYTLCFYQSQYGSAAPVQQTQTADATEYVCVARISLSEESFDKLLEAMERNKAAFKRGLPTQQE